MAWNAVISLVAATGIYGGLGWLADGWLNTGHVLFVIGLVGGNFVGIYGLYKRAQYAENVDARNVDAQAGDTQRGRRRAKH